MIVEIFCDLIALAVKSEIDCLSCEIRFNEICEYFVVNERLWKIV